MSQSCINNTDSFCYICSEFTPKSQQSGLTSLVQKAYDLYFQCKVGDQDKTWAPHYCCERCSRTLRGWLSGTRKSMPFVVPMVWREQRDHAADCYFCLTDVSGYSTKTRKHISYPDLPSAMRPVPHCDALPIPEPPKTYSVDVDNECAAVEDVISNTSDDDFPLSETSAPHLLTQSDLNDLVRDLSLSKGQSELLGSRLQEWNLLAKGTTVSGFRRSHALVVYFDMQESLCYCKDVNGLMQSLGVKHRPEE